MAAQSSQRRSLSPNRYTSLLGKVLPGCVVFLPQIDEDEDIYHCIHPNCTTSSMPSAASDHPVIILSLHSDFLTGDLMANVCNLSSNPRPCQPQYMKNGEEIRQSLPLSLTPKGVSSVTNSCFRSEDIMYLEGQGSLYKQSYIQISHVYSIPVHKCLQFGGSHPLANRIDELSYNSLMKIAKLEPTPWDLTPEEHVTPMRPFTPPRYIAKLPRHCSEWRSKKSDKMMQSWRSSIAV